MYERILVPLDGSHLSESILPYVQSLAKTLNAEIILLHVIVEPSTEFDPHTSPLSPAIELKIEKAETREYIKAVCTNLEKQNMRATYLIRDGAVGEMILEVVDTMKADLIAMSTHGRSGIQRLLMGSITEWIIKNSAVPVMVIHPKTE